MTLISRYLAFIKFEHTLFALPFALISLLVAAEGRPPLRVLFWVLMAMVGARSAAMACNRLVDRRIDAANPRTADRHLPTREISPQGALIFVVLAAAVFVAAAWRLNPLCLALSPVALLVVLGYSWLKRMTPLSHLVLGLGLAIAPVGAWLAVTGSFAFFPLVLCAAVLFWVAGFDTIYGCQDVDFDRGVGLHSLAVRYGVGGALRLSRFFHLLAVALLAGACLQTDRLGMPSLVGVGVVAGLLVWEQLLVRDGDLRHIDRAFFEINSWIGMVMLAAVLLDLYLL